jgi:predicted RND superfamily exporter protein
MTPPAGPVREAVGAIVDWSGRRPFLVLALAVLTLACTWPFALRVLANPRTDLRELLPLDSPALRAFEHQLGRIGGRATLIVIVRSPERRQNERFVDDLEARLDRRVEPPAAKTPRLIAYVEKGTQGVRRFFDDNKWLYADERDLREALDTLDLQIAIRNGLVADLSDDESENQPSASASTATARRPALGLDAYRARWDAKAAEHDDYPGGYFETADGTMAAVRIIAATSGMGDAEGDALLEHVRGLVSEMNPRSYGSDMEVGYAGDIANASAEKDSVVRQAAWASGIALLVIVSGVVWFYRSPWALIILGLPALIGIGAAYTFAYLRFGYVNTTGLFLGAIILGNGINYPIVLLSRYREFLGRGMVPNVARREAVQSALRAELVGACVASIAYGSLTLTRFRGFNQFGWIGLFGMLLVWVAMIPCVPALLAAIEAVAPALPAWLRMPPPGPKRRSGALMHALAGLTQRAPWPIVVGAVALGALAAARIPGFARDPWEYNFDKLGSRDSRRSGAGIWSNRAEQVFGGKMNVAGAAVLADSPDQVPQLKERILENDAADPAGPVIAEIATVSDFLPGTESEQGRKLDLLGRIRDRLSPAVLGSLPEDERARVEALRPPEGLHVLRAKDLPELLRRRFEENDGRLGTVLYVKYRNAISLSDGRVLLRVARTTDNVRLRDGTAVQTASRATVFAEMIRSMESDGPRATAASFLAVAFVVVCATRRVRGALGVLATLTLSVLWLVGGAAWFGEKLNYVNFVTLPITFGIGCEYPFNIYDRTRLLSGDVAGAVGRVGGAVALCSFTTAVGYASLLVSDSQALQSFGRLALSGEVACLLGALFTMPALLHLGLGKQSAPASAVDVAE